MARTDLTIQQLSINGINPSTTPAIADGHKFYNDGKTWFVAANSGGVDRTVTFITPVTVGGLAVADQPVTVPAGQTREIGPFEAVFNQMNGADAGKVYVDYSDPTGLAVAVKKI